MNQISILIFLFKVISLLSGVFTIYLGYKLFVKGIFNESGDVQAAWNNMSLLVKKAAPGTFFALFGAVVVSITIYKGFDFKSTYQPQTEQLNEIKAPSLGDSLNLNVDTSKIK